MPCRAFPPSQVQLETQLDLQGATAIEDKLQEGVPEVLADLRAAGVKLWMLTGDKVRAAHAYTGMGMEAWVLPCMHGHGRGMEACAWASPGLA